MKPPPTPIRLALSVGVGLLAISSGSIFIKLSAAEAPPLWIAFFRMFWASITLTLLSLARSRRLPKGTLNSAPLLLSGIALGLHFAFWCASLVDTPVAVSVLLVDTAPIFVAVLAYFFLGEQTSRFGILGIGLAALGVLILLQSGFSLVGGNRGPILALFGALMLALYFLMGRKWRTSIGLMDYIYPVYLYACLSLLFCLVLVGQPLPTLSLKTHLTLFLLGLIPQCVGHTLYNWSLAYLPATLVSMLVLGEPIVASLLALLFLAEAISVSTILGGALIGAGIVVVSHGYLRDPINA